MLRELLARGADKAVLVSGREFGGSDTFATSQILAAAVNKIGVGPEDVVFCGRQAIDGDTAQVGPRSLKSCICRRSPMLPTIQKDGNTLTVKRMLEDGYMMVKVQRLPLPLTCIQGAEPAPHDHDTRFLTTVQYVTRWVTHQLYVSYCSQ